MTPTPAMPGSGRCTAGVGRWRPGSSSSGSGRSMARPTRSADWLAMYALVLGGFRDFESAEAYLPAEQLAPGRPWLGVERASLLEMEDRYEDALAAFRASLAARPWYRPAVQSAAHLLQLLDRRDESLTLLEEAMSRMRSGLIAAQLADVQLEAGRNADAMRSYDRFAALSPLMDDRSRRWLAGRRSDVAYRLGDYAASAALARESKEPFYLSLADRLEAASADARRVRLAVGFVRQHHQTCAAGDPGGARAILGQGSRSPRGRRANLLRRHARPSRAILGRVERHGYARVPSDLGRGCRAAGSGHPLHSDDGRDPECDLQAVIGYDGRRGSLLIRDPTLPQEGEAVAELMLERYRSVGPRGMAMVPHDRADLFNGIDLPEARAYDLLHRIQASLRDHDRDAAAATFDALRTEAPGHPTRRPPRPGSL